jgi:RNA processing factor Prp31
LGVESIIGNQEMDMTKIVNEELANILSSNQIITISVTGSTTSGRNLSTEQWAIVESSCIYIDWVEEVKKELSTFLEQEMEPLVPNVCVIVGPTLAAQLFALAGGIGELAKLPAWEFLCLILHLTDKTIFDALLFLKVHAKSSLPLLFTIKVPRSRP